jgi:hypothetical protein
MIMAMRLSAAAEMRPVVAGMRQEFGLTFGGIAANGSFIDFSAPPVFIAR